MGSSGSGKSFMAACMSSLNYKLVADDILPISFDLNGAPGAYPYLRRLKLKRDSIEDLSLSPGEPVSERLDKSKYFVVPRNRACDRRWSQLHRLYLLEKDTAEAITIDRLVGADALRAIVDQTYHYDFIRETRQYGEHLALCANVVSKISVYRVRRSRERPTGLELGSIIRKHLGGNDGD
jgi:hypothetical protein